MIENKRLANKPTSGKKKPKKKPELGAFEEAEPAAGTPANEPVSIDDGTPAAAEKAEPSAGAAEGAQRRSLLVVQDA